MKAVRINKWATPVQIEEIPQPAPGAGEVLIGVHAASVNPVDRAIVAGYMAAFVTAPLTLGTDFAGEVVAVGEGVTHVSPGDSVYGMSLMRGTFAEYAVVNAAGVALKPRTLDNVEASAIPLTGLSAWQTLFQIAQLKQGERVLIHGAGGGIGSIAVQLAKNAGAYVIAHDKGEKMDVLRSLGADEFINADTERFEDKANNPDVVLDLVMGGLVDRSFAVLLPGGRYVATAVQQVDSEAAALRGIKASGTFTQPNIEQLTALTQDFNAGKLKVIVSQTFPLTEAQTALFANPPGGGKVVITV
ncbi:MAG: NADP-dependent oxidoreductase [Anaerolineae bacterium]|nr:NADP-dependent oxidoreductase [Anaerolineae bacterium]